MSIQAFLIIMKNYAKKQKIEKSFKYISIYSVFERTQCLGSHFGDPFETLLEVKRLARSILETF